MNGVGSGQNLRLGAQTVIADDIHAICSTTVPLGTRFTGLLTPGLYGSVETGWPVLCTGDTVWPVN